MDTIEIRSVCYQKRGDAKQKWNLKGRALRWLFTPQMFHKLHHEISLDQERELLQDQTLFGIPIIISNDVSEIELVMKV